MASRDILVLHILQLYLLTSLPCAMYAQALTSAPMISLITDSKFIGYWSATSTGTAWEPQYCPSDSTWYQSSSWARCCPTSVTNADCSMWTGCAGTSTIFMSGGYSTTCENPNSVCRTAVISQDANDKNPFLYVGCGTANWTAYRTPPQAVVITLTPTAKTTNSISTGTSTTSSPTSSTTSTPKKADSKIWIAGAVLGPIFLAAVAGLLWYIWVLRKRQARKADESAAPMITGAVGGYPVDPRQSYQSGYYQQPYGHPQQPYGDQPYGYKNQQQPSQMGPVELDAVHAPVEAPNEPMSPTGRK